MDRDQQRGFERAFAEQAAREAADITVNTLQVLLRDGISSIALLGNIPDAYREELAEGTAFHFPIDSDAMSLRYYANWQMAQYLQRVELGRVEGLDEMEIIHSIHDQLAQLDAVDELRLREGFFDVVGTNIRSITPEYLVLEEQ